MLLLLHAVCSGLLSAPPCGQQRDCSSHSSPGVRVRVFQQPACQRWPLRRLWAWPGDVTLPCRHGAAKQGGVEVCWGRGEPSLFTCHNAVISGTGNHVTYRRSNRFSLSSSSSLSISSSRPADTGFYHCRVQLPGLFNDQVSIVHLLIIRPPALISQHTTNENEKNADPADTMTSDLMVTTGSDVTDSNDPELGVARVQSQVQQHENSLQFFIGITLRFSSIIFIPLLISALFYRVWRSNPRFQTDTRPDQSEDEDDDSV